MAGRMGNYNSRKTGTAEFCDNIALKRDWCKVLTKSSQHTPGMWATHRMMTLKLLWQHFLYHGGEGSEWAAPVVRDDESVFSGRPVCPGGADA